MKRKLLILIALIVSVSISAQTESGKFFISPKAGATMSKFAGGGLTTNFKFGFIGGVEAGYQCSKMFAVTLGAFYSMEGCKSADDAKVKNATWTYNLINVPVLLNVYVYEGLALKAGIQPGFKLSSKFNSDSVTDMKSVNVSIPVGLSYEFSNVILDARYNIGITKVEEGFDLRSNVFQFTLGYKFNL